ncbi:MAG: histidinol dehydrogenase [Bryobacteraceae bacterium]
MLRILQYREADEFLRRRALRLSAAERVVAPILEAVRKQGDAALLRYAKKFDGLDRRAKTVALDPEQLVRTFRELSPEFRRALETASKNIRAFARKQLPRGWMVNLAGGLKAGQVVRPLDAAAAYIPSGRYPLPSTLLMTVIPAQVAGVGRVCVASPRPSPEILGAAGWLGVKEFYRMGGAHAIAAFAFGTNTVPKVDRIVGPGNAYVAAAKKLLAGEVGIDFVAGPTEILILAQEGNPAVLAADMLAQAEHDIEGAAVLVTTSRRLARAVPIEVGRRLEDLPTAATAREALRRNSAVILVPSLEAGVELVNRFAPEHLSIPSADLLPAIRSAGSIFIGPFSPEAAGDYASGTNHVLPTAGYARIRGGLSAADFVKVISVQQLSSGGLRALAPTITTLARAEGLEAHARSVEVRLHG